MGIPVVPHGDTQLQACGEPLINSSLVFVDQFTYVNSRPGFICFLMMEEILFSFFATKNPFVALPLLTALSMKRHW